MQGTTNMSINGILQNPYKSNDRDMTCKRFGCFYLKEIKTQTLDEEDEEEDEK